MELMIIVWLVLGFILLVAGAELLVRGASRLAGVMGVPSLVIGLTVVAYGTSAPELAVSVQSAWNSQANLALGNVVGSNIFNVLFILGVSALIIPLVVSSQLVRRDVPIMIGISLLLWLLALDGIIGRLDGLMLFAGAVAYTVWSIVQGRREQQQINPADNQLSGGSPAITGRYITWQGIVLLVGLALLVAGANRLVFGAVSLARFLNVSELVIGLTIIAVGTSLPEVAASIVASLRRERDIAVGNVIGSNIFNILVVLGVSATVSPAGISVPVEAMYFDIPVMIAVAVICLPIFFTGGIIARWEGLLFFGYYLAYTLYLLFTATQSSLIEDYQLIMITVVFPLTVLALLVSVIQSVRAEEWSWSRK